MQEALYTKAQFQADVAALDEFKGDLRRRLADHQISGLEVLRMERELDALRLVFKKRFSAHGSIFGALKNAKRAVVAAPDDPEAVRKLRFLRMLAAGILEGTEREAHQEPELVEAAPPVEWPLVRRNALGFLEQREAGRWLPVSEEHVAALERVQWRQG